MALNHSILYNVCNAKDTRNGTHRYGIGHDTLQDTHSHTYIHSHHKGVKKQQRQKQATMIHCEAISLHVA